MKYNEKNPPMVCMMTQSTCYRKTRTMEIKGILIHSTGANNPYLRRYVQPDDNASNREELLKILGKNTEVSDWNHTEQQAGLNAWIGKLPDGKVTSVQSMPWDYRPWGCGSGVKGSCNTGWIQFECAEDNLADKKYFEAVYEEMCELIAYLCKKFNINPQGYSKCGSVICPNILCHADSYKLGLGSNHADILHWFKRYGKTIQNVRDDVTELLNEDAQGSGGYVSAPSTGVNSGSSSKDSNEEYIWNFLFNEMENSYGVAGLMGNLFAESGLKPTNLQNTFEKKLLLNDDEYTHAVDNGLYTNFVKDGAGYGLAQWTYYSRKDKLLKFANSKKVSIGNLNMQLEFLILELKSDFPKLWSSLLEAETIVDASNLVLTEFEKPRYQSATVKAKRQSYAKEFYDKYHKGSSTRATPVSNVTYRVISKKFVSLTLLNLYKDFLAKKGLSSLIGKEDKYYYLQFGYFVSQKNAMNLQKSIKEKYHVATYIK